MPFLYQNAFFHLLISILALSENRYNFFGLQIPQQQEICTLFPIL